MTPGGWLLVGIVLVIVLVFLEGKRQERIYGKSQRRGMMRTGLLELQRQLEPERKVEILIEERDDAEADESAAPPTPPSPSSAPAPSTPPKVPR